MYKLVFIRHGESVWNLENRFTGWTDVDLSDTGVKEAHRGAQDLIKDGYTFDIAFTSVLKRAIKTLNIVLEDMDLMWVPVEKHWRLNERHYGALQGLNKSETAEKHGEEQVKIWRRSYDITPPELDTSDERYPGHDRRYSKLEKTQLPLTESLKLTYERFVPYWEEAILPTIKSGKRVLIAAHGNSLRAMVKYLDNVSNENILQLNIPTGVPLVYELDENCKPIEASKKKCLTDFVNCMPLGDPEEIAKAAQAVANQGKK